MVMRVESEEEEEDDQAVCLIRKDFVLEPVPNSIQNQSF
jgi:hypothetical protein